MVKRTPRITNGKIKIQVTQGSLPAGDKEPCGAPVVGKGGSESRDTLQRRTRQLGGGPIDVGRSSTVEHADVARETRVQLPPTTPNPDSSKGRTLCFGRGGRGSIPRSGAKTETPTGGGGEAVELGTEPTIDATPADVSGGRAKKFHDEAVANAGAIVNAMTDKERLAVAKVGLDALIDEATRYQEERPADALRTQLKKHGAKCTAHGLAKCGRLTTCRLETQQ